MQDNYIHISTIYNKIAKNCIKEDIFYPSPKTTAQHALDKLIELNLLSDEEMRHESSLSPFALLRKWHIGYSVRNSRHNYIMLGDQTSYGKGLSLDAARASYSMEIVERRSSFTGFNSEGDLVLETPYNNEELFWIEGEQQCGQILKPILIPVQCVFLFCNLDEINLYSGLGSTGLASGNIIEEAKTSALLEIIERESEGASPYVPSKCFSLEAEDPQIADLLEDYKTKEIAVQFQDITQPFGVPCYKCFVVNQNGEIVKGTSAHLDGKKALISALTETPYPYPNGSASNTGPNGLPMLRFENLPDYSTGNPVKDLAILESLLIANNYQPRVNPRLFANYLRLFQ